MQSQHSIRLLFNANKVYDRQVIEGIGHYLHSSKVSWDVYLEEDCLARINSLDEWKVDGVIADFDDSEIRNALTNFNRPVVGVGGSYAEDDHYPDVPYVATDNHLLVKAAFVHLKQKGLNNFAFYGMPIDSNRKWAQEREKALIDLCEKEGFECRLFRGHETKAATWHDNMNQLAEWIRELPSPTGVVAVTDARARHLLQACDKINKLVPDEISIVGIDDDDIARNLSRISLSSVSQGCFEMGVQAAKLLHRALDRATRNPKGFVKSPNPSRVLVPPIGVVERQSTDFKALQDPYVIQAMHFVRQHACRGIKVDQVVDYVGVSRSNLEQRFIQECGHSLHTEIHNTKLELACRLLKETEESTQSIAEKSGYPSLQYMYSVFKKHYNLTPKQYRKNAE